MSASNKKKLRKEQEMAKMTERQIAEQKEAKKLKITTISFTAIIAVVVVFGLGFMLYNQLNIDAYVNRNTIAVEIGENKLSKVDFNYFYMDTLAQATNYNDWETMYSYIAKGLNTSVALDKQMYDAEKEMTWADYFLDLAVKEASGVLALCEAANNEGHTLTESQIADLDNTVLALETDALLSNFKSLNQYLEARYGAGANESNYRAYIEKLALAQSYSDKYAETLPITEKEILDYEKEQGSYSSFDYLYFEVNPNDFIECDEADNKDHTHSVKETEAALQKAKEAAEAIVKHGATDEESLNAAINTIETYKTEEPTPDTSVGDDVTPDPTESTETTPASTEGTEPSEPSAPAETTVPTEATTPVDTTAATEATGETEATEGSDPTESTENNNDVQPSDPANETKYDHSCTHEENQFFFNINSDVGEWLIAEGRTIGDLDVVPYYSRNEDGEKTDEIVSYYVVLFLGENKNEENLVSVRHILIAYEGGEQDENGQTQYSEDSIKAAEDKILEIKAEWENGENPSEESFGELAKKYTKDGNGDVGGLYEDIYPNQMEEAFNDWCFAEDRKPGDVGYVHTSFGCHLIYFVKEQEETYREYMITTDIRAEKTREWFSGLRDALYEKANVKKTSHLYTGSIM